MTNFLELPTGRDVPNTINAIIEIPKGSSNKYEYDKDLNVFRLDRTLYSPVHYPGAYGFIPQTHSEDGDPLDVVVMVEGATYPGCLIEVRPLGVLVMRDDAGLDHKILAVPVHDPRMRDVQGLQHLASHYLAEVDYFFNIYKDLEGKKSDTYGWEDRLVAHKVINECVQRYCDLKAGLIDRWNKPTVKGKRQHVQIKRGTGTRGPVMDTGTTASVGASSPSVNGVDQHQRPREPSEAGPSAVAALTARHVQHMRKRKHI